MTPTIGGEDRRGSLDAVARALGGAARRSLAPGLGLGISLPVAALLRIEHLLPLEFHWALAPVLVPEGGRDGTWTDAVLTVTRSQADGLARALALLLGLALLGWLAALAADILGQARGVVADRRAWTLRSAVGATRHQLRREVLRQGATVSLFACGGGLLVAAVGCEAMARALPSSLRLADPVGAAMLAASPIVAVLLGLTVVAVTWMPLAWLPGASELRRPAAVHPDARDTVWLLAASQVAAGLAVAVCATLLATGASRIEESAGEYRHAPDTLVLRVHTPSGLTRSERAERWTVVRDTLLRLSGVRAAGIATPGAFVGLGTVDRGVSECPGCGSGGLAAPVMFGTTRQIAVDAGFLEVLGFSGTAPAVGEVLVDAEFQRQFFQGTDPTGRRVWLREATPFRTRGHRVTGVSDIPGPVGLGVGRSVAGLYLPLPEHPPTIADLAVRVDGLDDVLGRSVSGAVARTIPGARIETLGRLDELLLEQARPVAWLARGALWIATVALLFAFLGLADAMIQRVTARSAEIGLRRAVGARRRDVIRLVLVDGVRLALAGGAAGAALGASANRGLPGLVVGLEPLSVSAMGALVALLLLVGLAGSAMAAVRAARLDPAAALRG
ncbi:MAG: FtsX-like permease family protein [Gemmatimonadota bacterium]